MNKTATECPTCKHVEYTYKRQLRVYLLKPLALLSVNDWLTCAELSSLFEMDDPKLAKEVDKHFAELRYWGLIRKVEGKSYTITVIGQKFLDGNMRTREWIWTRNGEAVPPPDGEEDAPLKYVHQIAPHDFSEPRKHIEEAVPVQLSLV